MLSTAWVRSGNFWVGLHPRLGRYNRGLFTCLVCLRFFYRSKSDIRNLLAPYPQVSFDAQDHLDRTHCGQIWGKCLRQKMDEAMRGPKLTTWMRAATSHCWLNRSRIGRIKTDQSNRVYIKQLFCMPNFYLHVVRILEATWLLLCWHCWLGRD